MNHFKKYLNSGEDKSISVRTLRKLQSNYEENEQMPGPSKKVKNILENIQFDNVDNIEIENEYSDEISSITNLLIESSKSQEYASSVELNQRDENIEVHNLRESQKYENIHDFMNSKEFSKKLTTLVDVSSGELILMLLKFSVANSLSTTGLSNLFKLINTLFVEPVLPNSSYLLDKLLNTQRDAEFHAVCPNCSAYIGKFNEVQQIQSCSTCNADLNLSTPSNENFFITIDPSEQISDLLDTHANYYDYVLNRRIHREGHITDIYDGKLYRSFRASLSNADKYNYVSLIFNTDGAPKFKSSQSSIWPMYLMVNEIPRKDRMKNLVVCGLWFNEKKPNMSVFLDEFVDLMNKLSNNGIRCSIKGQIKLIKPFVLECCVDSVARAPMQGIKQFNGRYGCNWCEHPGVFAEGCIRYSLIDFAPKHRDKKETIDIMLRVKPGNPVLGIKYPSALINLHHFDIINGFDPDYLHSCLEGVGCQITESILQNFDETTIRVLDSKLKLISVPHQLSRLTRPLSERKDWKAREWENFILYYSVPLFSMYLNREIFYYWLLFVQSLYTLLKDDILIEELNEANTMLHEFVGKTEQIFGIRSMTFNIHQMLHICSSVFNWGPLWAHSTFPFESANYQLLKAIKCAKGVPQQILRFVHINHNILLLEENVYKEVSNAIKIYCSETLYAKAKHVAKISNIVYLGRGNDVDDDIINNLQLTQNSTKSYERMIYNGCLYTTSTIKNNRTNNSFAQLNDNRYIKIINFLIDEEENKELTLCQILKLQECFHGNYKVMKKISFIEEEIISVHTHNILTICAYIKIDNNEYICPLPNLLHY